MIDFSCKLYCIKSKKQLFKILGIEKEQSTQSWVSERVFPEIDKSKSKPRLLEKPRFELKQIQKKIKKHLSLICVPNYVFSGIKGEDRSYKYNALKHANGKFLFKIDLTAFFPSVSRDRVYRFFLEDLRNPPDIAEMLTNLTTIDLDKKYYQNIEEINRFLENKGVKTRKHLGSGFPTSPVLSYLVNHNMFSELKELADNHNYVMTVYIDDVVFSGKMRFSKLFKRKVFDIVNKNHYKISKNKTKCYKPTGYKLVTGVILTPDGRLSLKNIHRQKIISELSNLKKEPSNIKSRQRLKGLVNSARYIENGIFNGVKEFAYKKCDEENK